MKKCLAAAALLAAVFLLLEPEQASAAAREGLGLCAGTVIPALFPFFVVISLLLRLGAAEGLQRIFAPFLRPLFRLSGAAAAPLIAGAVGGYPAGARTAAELYGRGLLTRREAEVCLGFVNNCGPAFVVSYVGAELLGSAGLGIWLYLIHLLSALLTGMALCRAAGISPRAVPRTSAPPAAEDNPFTGAVASSLAAILNICAFVVLFRTLAGLLPGHLPAPLLGFFELVTGCAALRGDAASFVWAAGMVSWGGLSVHGQTAAVAGPLSLRWHWIGKGLQALLSLALAAGAARILFP